MTKGLVEGPKLAAVLALGALALGCGGESRRGTAVDEDAASVGATAGDGATSGDAASEVASPPGWSPLNDEPFTPPLGPGAAIVDSLRDRLLTFTGVGTIWQLPLSGAKADHWSALAAQGDGPSGAVGSAVYDAERDRVLARVDAPQPGGQPRGQLWAFSLSEPPTWRQMPPPPQAEIDKGLMALDLAGERLFVLGGANQRCGLWSLSLQEDLTWTRLAGSPNGTCGDIYLGFGGDILAFDGPRRRLVAATYALGIWQLGLEEGAWTQLDARSRYDALEPIVHDVAGARLLSLDPYDGQLTTFSLATDTWVQSTFTPGSVNGGLAALDEKRARVLYARGSATSELPLASLNPQPLLPDR